MAIYLDARIPVIFGGVRGPDDAALIVTPVSAHAPGCACCVPRSAAGRALAALLQDRARGRVPFFSRVIVDPAARAEVEVALRQDPVASACFRAEASPQN